MTAHVTPEQTMATWFARVGSFRPATVRDVFPDDDATEKAHRANCCILVRRGWLRPAVDDGVPAFMRDLNPAMRYFARVPPLPTG